MNYELWIIAIWIIQVIFLYTLASCTDQGTRVFMALILTIGITIFTLGHDQNLKNDTYKIIENISLSCAKSKPKKPSLAHEVSDKPVPEYE